MVRSQSKISLSSHVLILFQSYQFLALLVKETESLSSTAYQIMQAFEDGAPSSESISYCH